MTDYEDKSIDLIKRSLKRTDVQIIIGILGLLITGVPLFMANNEKQALCPQPGSVPLTLSAQGYRSALQYYNLELADYPAQELMVVAWLNDRNSGYPALFEVLKEVFKNRKLKGNAVPLTIINDYNLQEHGKTKNAPIIYAKDINKDRLKNALVKAWNVKNINEPASIFGEIISSAH